MTAESLGRGGLNDLTSSNLTREGGRFEQGILKSCRVITTLMSSAPDALGALKFFLWRPMDITENRYLAYAIVAGKTIAEHEE